MLKSIMHNSSSSHLRNDTTRTNRSAYEPSQSTESAKLIDTPKPESPKEAPQPKADEDGNKLIVGPNIKLKGSEITDCEILVVEGRVEASMNSRDIRIAEGGVFSGKAEIDVAEVRGRFEGDLTARKRLVIYSTGKVSGVIRYGAMKIEEGGTISGDVATLAPAEGVAKTQSTASSNESKEPQDTQDEASRSTASLSRSLAGIR